MPIAPIVGKLRKRLITDLSIGFALAFTDLLCILADSCRIGLGVAGGYLFWYTVHLPSVKRRDDYYIKYEANKA